MLSRYLNFILFLRISGLKRTILLGNKFKVKINIRILITFIFTYIHSVNLACVLRIIPTPWEVTLSRLLSIVSDFEREGHLKYKLA